MLDSPACPRCQHPVCNLFHVLWECPVFREYRLDALRLLDGIRPEVLPKAALSLHGLMPETSLVEGCLWPSSPSRQDASELRPGATEVVEQPAPAAQFDPLVQERFQVPCDPQWCTLQLLGRVMRGTTDPEFEVQVGVVNGLPPQEPNLHTDGSLMRPLRPMALAGCGLALSEGSGLEDPQVTTLMDDFCCSNSLAGASRWASIHGLHLSSTRSELTAIILACLNDCPVHIATDSQAAMSKALRILLEIKGQAVQDPPVPVSLKGPWGLHACVNSSDADLWHILDNWPRKGAGASNSPKSEPIALALRWRQERWGYAIG